MGRGIWAILRHGLWERSTPLEESRTGRAILRLVRVCVIAGRGFWADDCMVRATALAYTTMLSLVPLLAVAFSLFAAFPELENAYGRIRAFLNEYLAPGASKSAIAALDEFIANATSSTAAGIGTAALFVTAMLLLVSVEDSFNRIWRASRARPMFDRLVYYLAIVILGPLFLAVSVNAAIETVVREASTLNFPDPPFISEIWNFVLPVLASSALFTILFKAMPNTKVRWPAAVAGGLVTGILFEAAKKGYTVYAANAITYSTIYGALSAVPIFLVWVYLVWLVVLFGAEFSHGWQTLIAHQRMAAWGAVSQTQRESLAVSLAVLTARRFEAGEPGMSPEEMADAFDAPIGIVEETIQTLKDASVFVASGRGILPAKDPDHLTVWDILEPMRRHAGNSGPVDEAPLSGKDPALVFLENTERNNEKPYRETTLAELAARSNEPVPSPGKPE